MEMNGALRLVPLLRVLGSSLLNDRWKQFRRVFLDGLCAIAGQTPNHAASVLALPIVTSGGSVTELPALLQLASGYWISQAIYVAAKLGIADVLNGGPASGAQIAFATEANEGAILRLMRALCTVGVFRADDTGKFTVTALGRPLQCGVPGSLRAMIITLGEVHYAAWAHLIHSVRTGRTAFPVAFGAEMFDYLGLDIEAGATFNSAMTDCSALSSCAVLLSYNFSEIRSVVDVGGGCGKLLTSILRMYPEMHGTLFDLPSVIAHARGKLGADPCRDRCNLVSGNFLEYVPPGADVYLMSTVIHDWDDERAIRILTNCRRSMRQDSRVLLVEFVVPDGGEISFSTLFDLNMLVMNGGRERTVSEFRRLFHAAGLRMTRIIPTLSPLRVIEATCS